MFPKTLIELAATVAAMGLNVSVMVADSPIDDDVLSSLGLVPLGEDAHAEAVALTPADERACVAVVHGGTIVVDGGLALATAMDGDLGHLPGRVHLLSVVSSVDALDWRVLAAGETVRRLHVDDDGELRSEGEPLAQEVGVLDLDTDGAGEVDGDLFVECLPALAGLPAEVDLLDLTGAAYGPAEAAEPEPSVDEGQQGGFFRRLLGRRR